MYIIVVGCGRLGSNLAKELANEGNDICILERDGKKLESLGTNFNGKTVKGIEFDSENLAEAGIESADAVLAVSPDDNINLTVSLIADRIFKIPKVIARVNNPKNRLLYQKLNIDTVNPIKYESDLIKSKLSLDYVNLISVFDKEFELIEIHVTRDRKISKEELETKFRCVVTFIKRDHEVRFPHKDDIFLINDRIIVGVSKQEELRVISYLNKELFI